MTTLTGQDITNIVHAVIFTVIFLTIFFTFFFWRSKRNVSTNSVFEVDAREPHSVTITFVPVNPPDGIAAPAPTPHHGIRRTLVTRDGEQIVEMDEAIRIPPPAA